ncbi:MAG: diguanylate cyclase [Helicobacteraceae bacterium]|jgi:diguanylate cyclase (GGDEF)-like protein/PAS domain S-box-containing protein|nr:diguanylate cyclase [Helicobacteraceae bacterium]
MFLKNNFKILLLKAILPIVLFSMTLGALFFQYTINEKRNGLLHKSEVIVKVIGAILQFDSTNTQERDTGTATITQLQDAFSRLQSNLIPNQYLIGQRSASGIVFLAHSGEEPPTVPWEEKEKAIPMRLALQGSTGVIVDNDYAGNRVLAVYRPIPNTKWALVIKQPIAFYLRPFYIFGLSYLVFVLLFTFLLYVLLKHNESRHAKETAIKEHRFQELVESTDNWVWEVDASGVYTYCSSQVYDLLGYRPDEIIGTKPFDHMEKEEAETISAIFAKIVKEKASIIELENYNIHKDGRRVCHLTNGTPFFDDEGTLLGYRGIDKNITKLKEDQKAIEEMAYSDLLTHLANRRMSLQRIAEEIAYAQRHHMMGALLFIDLDEFKYVNDSSGHDCGDEVLVIVAERMQEEIRDSDIVGRIGGDEFIVLLRSAPLSLDALQRQTESLAKRIIAAINHPIVIHNKEHHVGASIGVAFIPQDGQTSDEVLKHADNAMYMAKELGKNQHFYYKDMLQE